MFVTGPGPEGGGSKPGKEGWAQMPEKSGMAVASLPSAGVMNNAADSVPPISHCILEYEVKRRIAFLRPSEIRHSRLR